jgi:hypothetical protein
MDRDRHLSAIREIRDELLTEIGLLGGDLKVMEGVRCLSKKEVGKVKGWGNKKCSDLHTASEVCGGAGDHVT